MAVLFHQNMRVFGGGTVHRNGAYNGTGGARGAFRTIVRGLGVGVGPVAVAGFTEIVNNGATVGALTNSCTRLRIAFEGNVACGITALANGPEYIGIGRDANYALVTVGRILINADRGIRLIHQRAATAAALNAPGLPLGATADYRGLVYLVVNLPGTANNIAVGFMHNLFNNREARTLVVRQVPAMMMLMGEAASGLLKVPNIIATYIGGDFNVDMITPRGAYTGYSANAPAYPAGAQGHGTTYNGHLYDYWYSSVTAAAAGLIVPIPSASSETLDAGVRARQNGLASLMSDHTATLLQIS